MPASRRSCLACRMRAAGRRGCEEGLLCACHHLQRRRLLQDRQPQSRQQRFRESKRRWLQHRGRHRSRGRFWNRRQSRLRQRFWQHLRSQQRRQRKICQQERIRLQENSSTGLANFSCVTAGFLANPEQVKSSRGMLGKAASVLLKCAAWRQRGKHQRSSLC